MQGRTIMKRGAILLIALVLMSIPISVNAQTTEFQVTNSSIVHDADGFDIALTVNWHSVAVVLRINGDFYSEDWTDGPDNTYLFLWFKYDHLGVDAGEMGELTIELSNATRVYEEYDYALEHPECVLTFAFSVPFPELVFVNEPLPPYDEIYELPHDYDNSPDFGIEPIPFDFIDGFISSNQWPILMLGFGCFLILLGFALGPEEKKQKTNNNAFKIRHYKESLRRVYPDTIAERGKAVDWDGIDGEGYSGTFVGIKMSKVDMPNVYPYPEEETIELPDLSNPDDDVDWRICPWCGTWTHGEKTRCIYCDGRLGRPLGRNTK